MAENLAYTQSPACWASDSELVQMVREGADEAFDELEARYRPIILWRLRLLCRNGEDTEEIIRQIRTGLYIKIRSHQVRSGARSTLLSWVHSLTINSFLVYKRIHAW
ncbi:MAG: hypothetical protein AB1640_23725 [bacterium]